jgi:predicted ABC-type ATPase
MSNEAPELIVIGGANGSGKTTIALPLSRKTGIRYLGADAIAAKLNPQNPADASIGAAREFIKDIDRATNAQESLIVESTLSGLVLRKWLVKSRQSGYYITIFFLYIESADLSIKRIEERVKKGEHFVPSRDVRRRFPRSNYNFWNTYKDLADEWVLFNNSRENMQEIASKGENDVIILKRRKYAQWLKMISNPIK